MSQRLLPTDADKLRQILANIETEIAVADPINDRDEKSFEYERGVLISVNEAELVVRAIKVCLTMSQLTIGGGEGLTNVSKKQLTKILSKAKHAHSHPKAPRRR